MICSGTAVRGHYDEGFNVTMKGEIVHYHLDFGIVIGHPPFIFIPADAVHQVQYIILFVFIVIIGKIHICLLFHLGAITEIIV